LFTGAGYIQQFGILSVLKPRPAIAVITASIGEYERRTKCHTRQTFSADYYCFTDSHDLENPGNLTLDYTPYDLMNISQIDNGAYRNSRVRNTHTYMISRFYKAQFHRIPRLRQYHMILWVDMTVRIAAPDFLEKLWSIFQTNPTRQMILISHWPQNLCTIRKEVEAAVSDYRWLSTSMMFQSQPFQDVRGQYEFYLRNGYNERYWAEEDLSYRGNSCFGLWQCNVIAYRMTDPIIPRFLDWWYFEQLNQTTEDQVSFPYVAQKLNIRPYTLPDNTYDPDRSKAIEHISHGQ
jgi:hypothetical protein